MSTNTTAEASENVIPKWILWYGIIVMIGAPLIFAIITFAGPNLGFVALADGSEIDTGLFKYAVRNLVAAGITGYALYKWSAPMLLLVFFMRFATETGDMIDSLIYGGLDTSGVLGLVAMMVIVFLGPYVIGIRKLWPMVR